MATKLTAEPLLTAKGLSRVFVTPAGEKTALEDINLQIFPGELVVLRGPSGAGKTTLLNLLGGLDRATTGEITLAGSELNQLSDAELAELRQKNLGFVFQTFGLLPVFSAAENVEVPLRIRNTPVSERSAAVATALEQVGLSSQAAQRPYELSGGQQQRVGLARALVGEPALLIADEPTGQLDSKTAKTIMALIEELVRAKNMTAIVSTHDPEFMERADKLLTLQDGKLV